MGVEPTTTRLRALRSANWANRACTVGLKNRLWLHCLYPAKKSPRSCTTRLKRNQSRILIECSLNSRLLDDPAACIALKQTCRVGLGSRRDYIFRIGIVLENSTLSVESNDQQAADSIPIVTDHHGWIVPDWMTWACARGSSVLIYSYGLPLFRSLFLLWTRPAR